MRKLFHPNEYVESIKDIDYVNLRNKGINGLIFDIDNTIVSHKDPIPGDEEIELFEYLKELGFKVSLVSNNNKNRVDIFNLELNIPAYSRGLKPLTFGVNKALSKMGTKARETAIIGDQVFTDVLCGKFKNMYTILVEPINLQWAPHMKIKRVLENIVLKNYK